MIKIENTQIFGWKAAIRGMRNPKESRMLSDSIFAETGADDLWCVNDGHVGFGSIDNNVEIGPNDYKLMMSLAKGGPVHAKYRRMIVVYADITAPLYLWKQIDQYKIGTVTNSTSTMHKIHARDLTINDFSHEYLKDEGKDILQKTVDCINANRKIFMALNDEEAWLQMIQLLPSSYNQLRTWMANYEVLTDIYHSRKDHKLDEWHDFCGWIESLPYSELITGELGEKINE